MLNSYKNVEIKSTTESKKCVPPARFEPGTSWGQTFGILRGFTYITFYMVIQFVICYLHKIYGSLLISCIPLDLKSTLNIVFFAHLNDAVSIWKYNKLPCFKKWCKSISYMYKFRILQL